MKTVEDFAQESAMMRLQNVVLSEELEKAEAMAQEIEVKVKLLEETVEAREAEVELKEKK